MNNLKDASDIAKIAINSLPNMWERWVDSIPNQLLEMAMRGDVWGVIAFPENSIEMMDFDERLDNLTRELRRANYDVEEVSHCTTSWVTVAIKVSWAEAYKATLKTLANSQST